MLPVSAPVQPGNSGGPLLDQSGNVVGVIVSKLDSLKYAAVTNDVPQNINFAIKANVALNVLETNSVTPNSVVSSSDRPAPTSPASPTTSPARIENVTGCRGRAGVRRSLTRNTSAPGAWGVR